MRNVSIFRVLSLYIKARLSALAFVFRVGLLLILATISFVPASANIPEKEPCVAGEICEQDRLKQRDESEKNQLESLTKPWITIDEPANFALLAMGIFGLLLGRWAARHRVPKSDEK